MFTVTVSTPGCLPEADPIECDDLTEARQALAEEIERDWSEAYEQSMEAFLNGEVDREQDRLRIDGIFMEAHSMANLVWANESLTCNGLVYEIHGG